MTSEAQRQWDRAFYQAETWTAADYASLPPDWRDLLAAMRINPAAGVRLARHAIVVVEAAVRDTPTQCHAREMCHVGQLGGPARFRQLRDEASMALDFALRSDPAVAPLVAMIKQSAAAFDPVVLTMLAEHGVNIRNWLKGRPA